MRGWSDMGKETVEGSRGLWSGFRREGSRSVKEVHSRSAGTAIAMARCQQRHKKGGCRGRGTISFVGDGGGVL